MGLRWSDIDGDTLRVRRTLSRVDGVGIVEGEPKTAKARRTLDLSDMVVSALAAHRKRQLVERLSAGVAWYDEDRVFCTTVGTALDPRGVNRAFAEVAGRAGVKATPQTMRRSVATALLSAGHPVAVVGDLLGHSGPMVTLSTYAHSVPTGRKAAADAMAALLG